MITALILDATVIRLLLVPAVMHMLREDNWWAPRWVQRLSEKVGHNEQLADSPVAVGAAEPALVGAGAPAAAGAAAPAARSAAETTPQYSGQRSPLPAPLADAHSEEADVETNNEEAAEPTVAPEDENSGQHGRTVPFEQLMAELRRRKEGRQD